MCWFLSRITASWQALSPWLLRPTSEPTAYVRILAKERAQGGSPEGAVACFFLAIFITKENLLSDH